LLYIIAKNHINIYVHRWYSGIHTYVNNYVHAYIDAHKRATVVWKKIVVENIHMKIIHCKTFRRCWHPMKIFIVKFFTIELYFSSSWVLFDQFQLDKNLLSIKVEVCERNSCVYVTITTDKGCNTGEEQLKCKRVQIMKVIDSYVVAVKKEGRIISYLLQKISWACRITFAILTLCNDLASLGFCPFSLNSSCTLQFAKL